MSELILKSADWPRILGIIGAALSESSSFDHSSRILDSLEDEADAVQRPYLEELKRVVEKHEEEHVENLYGRKKEEIVYPFTRKNRKSKMEEALFGINDDDEVRRGRKDFYRKWYREKAAYDKKMERKKRMLKKGIDK